MNIPTSANTGFQNSLPMPGSSTADQAPIENNSVKPSDVKKHISQYFLQHRKIPLRLRTVLNLTDNACLSLLKHIPKGGTIVEKTEAIHHIVDTIISSDLTNDQLRTINDLVQQPRLVAKQLEIKDLHTSDFTHQHSITKKNQPLTNFFLDNLGFSVFHNIDSIEARIEVINQVTLWVCKHHQKTPDSHLTFISMGAGALLMEHLVHQQITKSGIPDEKITWRCIDINYSKENPQPPGCFNAYADARNQFKQDKNVRYFTTATAYLDKKTTDGQQLSAMDKNNGVVVVLEFNPPTSFTGAPSGPSGLTDRYTPSGSPCKIEKANSVFLFTGPKEHKPKLEEAVADFNSTISWEPILTPTIKISMNASGAPKLWLSEAFKNLFGMPFCTLVTNVLLYHLNNQPDTICSPIIRAEKELYRLKKILAEEDKCAVIFPYSEYNDSIDQLTGFFYSNKQDTTEQPLGALFKLQNRQITIIDSAEFIQEPVERNQ